MSLSNDDPDIGSVQTHLSYSEADLGLGRLGLKQSVASGQSDGVNKSIESLRT